jgi:hypothetical protein
VHLHVPAKAVQISDVLSGILLGVGQRGDDGEGFHPAAGDIHGELHLPQGQGLGNLGVLLGCHPRRPLGTRPGNQVVARSQPTPPAKVAAAAVVQAGAHVNPALGQQHQHHKGTEVPVEDHHILGVEGRQQLPQQRGFAGLFTLIRPDGQVAHGGGGQREHDAGAGQREAQARTLHVRLGKRRLILRGIGHREGEPVDQLGVQPLPQPRGLGPVFQLFGDLPDQTLQRRQLQLRPGATVRARVSGRRPLPGLQQVRRDVGHRGGADDAFAVPQRLRQKGPQHDLGGEEILLPEEGLFLPKHPLDRFGVQYGGKRQTRIMEK